MILKRVNNFFNHQSVKIVAILFFIIFFIVFITPFFINFEKYKKDIENAFEEKLFLKIKINEKITYNPFLRPHIELNVVDIFDVKKKEEFYLGNIYKVKVNINIFNLIFGKININQLEIYEGLIELQSGFFQNIFENYQKLEGIKKIEFHNIDLKYFAKNDYVEFTDVKGNIFFKNNLVDEIKLNSQIFGLPINIDFRGDIKKKQNVGNLKIKIKPAKFNVDFDLESIDLKKNNFMGFGKLKVGNENSTIGLNNINLQFNFNVTNNEAIVDKIVINSYLFKGTGHSKIMLTPKLFLEADFSFQDTNFKKLSNKNLFSDILKSELFSSPENFFGVFKLNFKNMVTGHGMFNNANTEIVFESGDVVIRQLDLTSKNNDKLSLNGRFVTQNRETIFFFNSQIEIQNLKNFYRDTNGPREKIALLSNDNFIGNLNGDLNVKRAKVFVNNISTNRTKKFSRSEINSFQEELNLRLNKNITNAFDPRIYSFLF